MRASAVLDEAALRRVRHLVATSQGDPLAPFALRPDKQYVMLRRRQVAIAEAMLILEFGR